ncbi:transcriptional regulator family: Zinc finger, CCHC-type [Penicillium roqueforti]|nr:transcriptional regulator family: Zinc finger, CCHC-type [Penicillium roqueforti]KAI3186707.1 transcriptional regulator family: Zinc finger, CCHC-type [Penicillium roqueforti]
MATTIDNLTIERNEAIAHLNLAQQERDRFAYRLLNNAPTTQQTSSNSGTPIVEARVKSAKMPDAPILKDGKEVRFETWETIIRQKLEANSDHYPLPVHRKIYVQSRCEGKAQLHIAPRMSATSSNPYLDAEDIIAHLRTVFANPNRKTEAYTNYHKLQMKPRDDFTDFLAEFMQLAEEAAVVEENRKRDLYLKLPYLLQTQVMWAVNQDLVSFDAFVQTCHSMAHEISLQQEKKTVNRARAAPAAGGSGGTQTATTTYTPRIKKEPSASYAGNMTTTEREALMREGKCFYCKEKGHMTRDCPKKQAAAAVVAAADTRTPRVTDLEELESDDQGKATA